MVGTELFYEDEILEGYKKYFKNEVNLNKYIKSRDQNRKLNSKQITYIADLLL